MRARNPTRWFLWLKNKSRDFENDSASECSLSDLSDDDDAIDSLNERFLENIQDTYPTRGVKSVFHALAESRERRPDILVRHSVCLNPNAITDQWGEYLATDFPLHCLHLS